MNDATKTEHERRDREARALVVHLRALAAEAGAEMDRCTEVAVYLAADAVEAGAVPRLLAARFGAWPVLGADDGTGVVTRAVRALNGA